MGCCNKKRSGKPIGRLRYYGGVALLGGVQTGVLLTVHAIALPFPRYRKLLPFCRAFVRETFSSVWQRERIRLHDEPDPMCELESCAVETAP